MSSPSDLYRSGMSLTQVSAATGIPVGTLRYRFHKLGILRSPAESIRLKSERGEWHGGKIGRKLGDEARSNMSAARRRWAARNAAGVSMKPSGYIECTMGPNKGRGQHRVIAEKMLGRRLQRHECVHHINGDRADNRPENLQVMTRAEHASHHASENISSRTRNRKGQFQ